MEHESEEISISTINKCNGKECPKINYLYDANQKLFIGVGTKGQSILRQIAFNCALFENKEPCLVRFGDINDIANMVNNHHIVFIACSASDSQLETVRKNASASSFVMTFIYDDNLICRQTIEPNNNECIIPISNSDIICDIISDIYISLCEPQFICRDIKDLRKAHGGKIGEYFVLNGLNINYCLEQYKEMSQKYLIFNKIQALSIFFGFNSEFNMDEILHFTKSVVQNIHNDAEIMFNIAVSNHIINSPRITLLAS